MIRRNLRQIRGKGNHGKMKRRWVIFKFIVTGGFCTCIDFSIYMCLSTVIAMSYAKCISMFCSCTMSFFLNKLWTFRDKKSYTVPQVLKFAITQLINISVNVGCNIIIYDLTQMKILAFVLSTLSAMTVNYLLQKKIVFREG
ncbi:GtrA family protein [Lacrimispora algidixylanolytica]